MKTVTLLIRQWNGHLYYEMALPTNLVIPTAAIKPRITALVSRYITHYVGIKPPRRLSNKLYSNVLAYYPNPHTRDMPLYIHGPNDTLYEICLTFDLNSKVPIADNGNIIKIS